MEQFDVAVIGAGAAGALVTIHLARLAPHLAAALVGRGPAGLGVAYSTPDPAHLLNVPAGRMSAFPDDPDHFVAWLRARGIEADGTEYVRRSVYGDYVHEILAAAPVPPYRFVTEATDVAASPDGVFLVLASGERLEASAVILATGVLVPPTPPALRGASVRAWEPGALDGIPAEEPVLLLGTGLTMVDAALSLQERGHRGALHALSRHGLLPAPHAAVPPEPQPADLPRGNLRAMVRAVRTAVREADRRGNDWRGIVDGMRPLTTELWASLSFDDCRRFFRHVRPYWDVHRHRMAPESARALYALRRRGRLQVHAGTVEAVHGTPGDVVVRWRPRGTSRRVETRAARVIDCVTAAGLTEAESPLLRAAERAGLVRPDPLGLGIETGPFGAALTADGPSERVFAVGALRRYERWESTAIPELRAQAAALAGHLAARRGRRAGVTGDLARPSG